MIPRNIIQTGQPEHIRACAEYLESISKYAHNFVRRTYSNEGMRDFMEREYPQWLAVFDRLPVFIQSVDFFRYVAVYHFGGVYLDMDVRMLRGFGHDFLQESCVFPVDTLISQTTAPEERFSYFKKAGQRFLLGQYAFAADAKHPFIKFLIDGIVDNIDAIINANNGGRLYIYQTTGPDYVTRRYMEFPQREEVHVLTGVGPQRFGAYAQHHHMGSWKADVPDLTCP